MGKFSDSPHFLLKHYLDNTIKAYESIYEPILEYQNPYPFLSVIKDDIVNSTILEVTRDDFWYDNTLPGMVFSDWDGATWNLDVYSDWGVSTTDGSYLVGPKTNISVKGGSLTELWIKDDSYGFYPIGVRYVSIDDNNFRFVNEGVSDYKPGDTITEVLSGESYEFVSWNKEPLYPYNQVENGSEVYFRKDSFYHNWLDKYANTYFMDTLKEDFVIRDYINTDVTFSYFGEFYKAINDAECTVIYEGLKDFAVNAIPSHQRTDKFVDFLWIFFDKVYQQHYNLLKNMFTLIDPKEIDTKYLGYLAKYFKMFDIINQDDIYIRDYVQNLPSMLKRKGTYSEFYIIWKIISSSINRLNVYEKWHDSTIVGQVSASDFEEYIYIDKPEYDNDPPTDGAGENWYLKHYPTDIPGYEDSGKVISTHYRLEFDINIEPLHYNEILTKELWDTLYKFYEYLRPISKVSDYRVLFSPRANFSGLSYDLYQFSEKTAYCNSVSADYGLFDTNGYVHTQIDQASDVWLINHNFNSSNIMVQIIGEDFDVIQPENIHFISDGSLSVTFPVPVKGYALLRKSERSELRYPPAVWTIHHLQDQKEVVVQFKKNEYSIKPKYIELIDDEILETAVDLYKNTAIIGKGDHIFVQSLPDTIWAIHHPLKKGVIMAVFDTNDMQMEPSLYDIRVAGEITIEFRDAVAGYVVLYNVGNLNVDDVIDDFEESIDTVSYWKISDTEGRLWNRNFDDTIINEELVPSGAPFPDGEILDYGVLSVSGDIYSDEDYYYFDINLDRDDTYPIREISLYNKYERQMFYTRNSELYKSDETDMIIHYRVRKSFENI